MLSLVTLGAVVETLPSVDILGSVVDAISVVSLLEVVSTMDVVVIMSSVLEGKLVVVVVLRPGRRAHLKLSGSTSLPCFLRTLKVLQTGHGVFFLKLGTNGQWT